MKKNKISEGKRKKIVRFLKKNELRFLQKNVTNVQKRQEYKFLTSFRENRRETSNWKFSGKPAKQGKLQKYSFNYNRLKQLKQKRFQTGIFHVASREPRIKRVSRP